MPLDIPQPLIGGGEIAFKGRVMPCIPCQFVEIMQGVLSKQLTGGRRTGKIPNRIANIKNQRIGQTAHIIEAALRASALGPGDVSLMKSGRKAQEERQEDQSGRDHLDFVPLDKLLRAVGERGSARDNR